MTTSAEHFGLLGALSASPARVVVVGPRARRDPAPPSRRARACWRSRRCSGRRARCSPCGRCGKRRASPCSSTGRSRSARSRSTLPASTSSRSRVRSGSAAPTRPAPSSSRDPEWLRVASPSYFSQASYELDGTFEPRPGAARFEPNWWSAASLRGAPRGARRAARVGLRPRLRRRGALPRAARAERRARHARGARDARRLPAAGRRGRARRAAVRARRPRP